MLSHLSANKAPLASCSNRSVRGALCCSPTPKINLAATDPRRGFAVPSRHAMWQRSSHRVPRANGESDGPVRIDLESASDLDVWKEKPAWCQPWTILLTGTAIVSGSFLVFHSKWFTGVIAVPIALWWYVFLVLYPESYKTYRLQEMQQMTRQANDLYDKGMGNE